MTRKTYFAAILAAVTLSAPALSSAALLVDFQPVTEGPNAVFTGTPGSKTLTMTSTLINLRSTVDVPSLAAPIVDGYEIFDDTVLTLTFTEASGATLLAPGTVFQPITSVGTFIFRSSPVYGNTVLLAGQFGFSSLFGTVGIGSIMSPSLFYTGGAIVNQLPVANPIGDSILGLSLVTPTFGVSASSVNDFTARLQGQLTTTVIPEPASVGMVSVTAVALLSRRRRA